MKRVPSSSSMTWSMICSADWPGDRRAADVAVRVADPRPEQAQVVVDLGDRADRRARVARRRLLVDRDRRGKTLDRVHVRLVHLAQELARVGAQRLDVAALTLGVDRVERQRGLAGPRQPRNDDEGVSRDRDVDVLQVVFPGARDDDLVARRHEYISLANRTSVHPAALWRSACCRPARSRRLTPRRSRRPRRADAPRSPRSKFSAQVARRSPRAGSRSAPCSGRSGARPRCHCPRSRPQVRVQGPAPGPRTSVGGFGAGPGGSGRDAWAMYVASCKTSGTRPSVSDLLRQRLGDGVEQRLGLRGRLAARAPATGAGGQARPGRPRRRPRRTARPCCPAAGTDRR